MCCKITIDDRKVGQLPSNFRLNRFGNILPYDKHRVTLGGEDDDGGDFYVNASHVGGYGDPPSKA